MALACQIHYCVLLIGYFAIVRRTGGNMYDLALGNSQMTAIIGCAQGMACRIGYL